MKPASRLDSGGLRCSSGHWAACGRTRVWAKQTNWANPDGSGRAGLRRTDRGLGLV